MQLSSPSNNRPPWSASPPGAAASDPQLAPAAGSRSGRLSSRSLATSSATAFGVSLVRRIAELHGGGLETESVAGDQDWMVLSLKPR